MKTKTFYDYLYLKKSKIIKNQEHYEVIKIKVFNNDRFTAELKARTYAKKNKLGKLAGGFFTEDCKPHDLKTHYKIYNCPDNTKVSRPTKHDNFIANLIEYEENMGFTLI